MHLYFFSHADFPLQLHFVHGNLAGTQLSFDVPALLPGQETDVTATLCVPPAQGRYMSVWQLQCDAQPFGHRVWCAVVVSEPTATSATPAMPGLKDDKAVVDASCEIEPQPSEHAGSPASENTDFVMVEHDDAAPPVEIAADLAESMMADASMYFEPASEAKPEPTAAPVGTAAEQPKAEPVTAVPAAVSQPLPTSEQLQELQSALLDTEPRTIPVDHFVQTYAPQPPALSTHDANIRQVMDMGFFNRPRISKLLFDHKEDVAAVVNALLMDLEQDWASTRH